MNFHEPELGRTVEKGYIKYILSSIEAKIPPGAVNIPLFPYLTL
jgi:hypothetical protein